MKHNFGEKDQELGLPVWQSPKFIESRAKAIELIDSGKYGLTDQDFWILMNKTKSGKMAYTGLIISHNGCLKINDSLPAERQFKGQYLTREINLLGDGGITFTYNDGTLYEIGSISPKNCNNAYPLEMAYKRCFDRVVLKLSKVAYGGIYSEVESEEFKTNVVEEVNINEETGEVIETKPIVQVKPSPAKAPIRTAPKPVVARVERPAPVADASNQVAVPTIQEESMSVEEALNYKSTSTRPEFGGKTYNDILGMGEKVVMPWLSVVSNRAKGKEKAAADAIISALKSGSLVFAQAANA